MSGNPKIEAILEAWWEATHCEKPGRAAARLRLEKLIDQIIGSQKISREDVFDHLHGHFLEYRKERRRRESVSISQSSRK